MGGGGGGGGCYKYMPTFLCLRPSSCQGASSFVVSPSNLCSEYNIGEFEGILYCILNTKIHTN